MLRSLSPHVSLLLHSAPWSTIYHIFDFADICTSVSFLPDLSFFSAVVATLTLRSGLSPIVRYSIIIGVYMVVFFHRRRVTSVSRLFRIGSHFVSPRSCPVCASYVAYDVHPHPRSLSSFDRVRFRVLAISFNKSACHLHKSSPQSQHSRLVALLYGFRLTLFTALKYVDVLSVLDIRHSSRSSQP